MVDEVGEEDDQPEALLRIRAGVKWGSKSLSKNAPASRPASLFQMHRDTPSSFISPQLYRMSSNLRSFGTVISGNRQPNQEINPNTRADIIATILARAKRSAVARDFGVSPAAMTRILQRFEETDSL